MGTENLFPSCNQAIMTEGRVSAVVPLGRAKISQLTMRYLFSIRSLDSTKSDPRWLALGCS